VLGDAIVEIGHEFGTVTGRRRRPGWLDLVMLRHAVRLNSLTEIALTKLDVLDTFDTIQLGIGYTLNGKKIAGYPDDIELLGRVEAEYVELEGWKTNLRECRTFESMPLAARTFVETVERHVGVPVTMIGVGPERDDCVIR
jgi:adenylosuccinate synthase